jgi:acyl-coenzyme A thioesterase PaaI-like protein
MAAKDGRQYRFHADLDLSSRDEVAFPDRATRIILQRMAARTHLQGDPQLCGTLISSGPAMAEAELATDSRMRVDELGFVFGLADYAAMLAVNEPNVVLAAAEARFLKPVRVGDGLVARASRIDKNGREHRVQVAVQAGQITVFEGELSCLVPSTHVLEKERQP